MDICGWHLGQTACQYPGKRRNRRVDFGTGELAGFSGIYLRLAGFHIAKGSVQHRANRFVGPDRALKPGRLCIARRVCPPRACEANWYCMRLLQYLDQKPHEKPALPKSGLQFAPLAQIHGRRCRRWSSISMLMSVTPTLS